ncbi:MAG: hypothetical protein PHF69_03640 [Candidatus Omnitrophica bacterium]|nr:hypothetical protein [Candidatus Omnitrophota bacterium]
MVNRLIFILKKIGILFIGLIFVILLLEICLRSAGYLYSMKRSMSALDRGDIFGSNNIEWSVKENSLNSNGTKTILCLGDSFTFGGNVKEKDCYPYQLMKLIRLKNKGAGVRIINKGHCEYNSNQVLRDFLSNIKKFTPKIIILLVGSSDKFNLIGNEELDSRLIYEPDYEEGRGGGGLTGKSVYFNLRDMVLESRVYKIAKIIKLNLIYRKLSWEIKENGEALSSIHSPKIRNENFKSVCADLERYYYQKNYEKVMELALESIRNWPLEPEYYIRGIGSFYALAWAYDFQGKYDSQYVIDSFDNMTLSRPELKQNKVFLKYYKRFKDLQESDEYLIEKLKSNLEKMIKICKAMDIDIIIQNYPSSYVIVNNILREAAARNNLLFIDNYAIFNELMIKNGRNVYLIGDDHCTPAGYRVMAENIYNAAKELINR